MVINENENTLKMTPRRALVVWVYSLKQLKILKRLGYMHYVSKKMKYVILYVNDCEVDETIKKLEKQFFVRSVEKSVRPDINMNFTNRLGNNKSTSENIIDFEEQNTEIVLADFDDDPFN